MDGDSVKNITRVRLGTGRPGDDRERHFKAMARALDIWKELKGLGIEKFSAGNSFWFAHPVYFLNHLDRAGLLRQSVEDRIKMGAANIKDVLPAYGPCFMRALQGGVSSWAGINMTEEQIRSSITALKPKYVADNWRVLNAMEVIFNALEIHGFKRTDFSPKLYDPSKRDFVLTEEQGFIFTIIPVIDLNKNPRNTEPDHWQEGDSEGNLVWDPFWGTQVKKNYGILRNGTDSPRLITVKKKV
jgi:hypothetical protein